MVQERAMIPANLKAIGRLLFRGRSQEGDASRRVIKIVSADGFEFYGPAAGPPRASCSPKRKKPRRRIDDRPCGGDIHRRFDEIGEGRLALVLRIVCYTLTQSDGENLGLPDVRGWIRV